MNDTDAKACPRCGHVNEPVDYEGRFIHYACSACEYGYVDSYVDDATEYDTPEEPTP